MVCRIFFSKEWAAVQELLDRSLSLTSDYETELWISRVPPIPTPVLFNDHWGESETSGVVDEADYEADIYVPGQPSDPAISAPETISFSTLYPSQAHSTYATEH